MDKKLCEWSVACPRCANVATSNAYVCTNCGAKGKCCVEHYAPSGGSGIVIGNHVTVSAPSPGGTYFICGVCKGHQLWPRCGACGTDLSGILMEAARKHARSLPTGCLTTLLIFVILVTIVPAVLVSLVPSVLKSLSKNPRFGSRQIVSAQTNKRYLDGLISPVSTRTNNGASIYESTVLNSLAQKGYIHLEGRVIINGNLNRVTIRGERAYITVNGNVSGSKIELASGGTFRSYFANYSTVGLSGSSAVNIATMSHSFVYGKHVTVRKADNSYIVCESCDVTEDVHTYNQRKWNTNDQHQSFSN